MTKKDKPSLYESVMYEVAKVVKNRLNKQSLFFIFSDYSVTDFTRLYVAGDIEMLWSKEFDECDDKKRALNDYSEFIDRLESISKTPSDVQDFFHTLLVTLKQSLKGLEQSIH